MATYLISSDKTFLRCIDVGVVEVCELDSLHVVPVRQGYFSQPERISMGNRKQYTTLKIGNREIKGHQLREALEDLLDSQLLVNREGLCFLPSNGRGGHNKVDYYRIFDRFDWGKYGAKHQVNTRWAFTDVLDGRPIKLPCEGDDDYYSSSDVDEDDNSDTDEGHEQCKQKLSDKEKELEEEKGRREKEVEELKMKHKEEIEKEKIKIQVKVAELEKKEGEQQEMIGKLKEHCKKKLSDKEKELEEEKGKHEKEMEELKRKHEEEIEKEKSNEKGKFSELEKKEEIIGKLKEELYQRVQKEVVNTVRISYPYWRFAVSKYEYDEHNSIYLNRRMPTCYKSITVSKDALPLSNPWKEIIYVGDDKPTVELQNWWAVTVLWEPNHERIIVYYDGSYGTTSVRSMEDVIYEVPVPVKSDDILKLYDNRFYNIAGVGIRYVLENLRHLAN